MSQIAQKDWRVGQKALYDETCKFTLEPIRDQFYMMVRNELERQGIQLQMNEDISYISKTKQTITVKIYLQNKRK